MSKLLTNPFYLILLSHLINLINASVLVKAEQEISFSCDRNIYYILIDVSFSSKPEKEYYPFTLELASPEFLNFKCMLDFQKKKIYCFRAFPDEEDYIEAGTFFQFPYPFPEVENIEWDYNSFLQNVYRRVWNTKADCGNEKIYESTDINFKKWELEGSISLLDNGECKVASLNKEDVHKYFFDMTVNFKDGDLVELLSDKNNKDEIELLQEIWVPLLSPEDEKAKTKFFEDEYLYAYCSTNEKININNYSNFKLNCYIPIELRYIFNGIIKISTFFDKIYVRQGKTVNIVSTYIKANETEGILYSSLGEKDHGILCPNQPVFNIEDIEYITMGEYYNETNKYTFFLTGTLTNGYYAFKNGTTVELNQTYKDISFNLIVQDNLIDSDEKEVNVSCILPTDSPYILRNKAIIKCIGAKENISNQNRNVDIILNWKLKANNNFNDIIISWPLNFDGLHKKNIYSYQLTGLSIRQTNFGCHNNNFDFYVYIYDLGREPRLNFELPLTSPKNMLGNCEIFDSMALKCSINLKHAKISKGTQIMLPALGSENEIGTEDGNKILFTMNNYSEINNDKDIYVMTNEDCGDYLVVGTLKDMGMSHKSSTIVYIILIVFICLVIAGFIIYFILKMRFRYKRGKKLSSDEQSHAGSSVGAKLP